MSDQLTVFERALLEQFKRLAAVSQQALEGSQATSEALRELSEAFTTRMDQIEKKQSEIESSQMRLLEALDAQNKQAKSLSGQCEELLKLLKP